MSIRYASITPSRANYCDMKSLIFLLASLTIVSSHAASVDDLTFRLIYGGSSYKVTDCDDSAQGELVIPSSYNGKPVTEVAGIDNAEYLTSVIIPSSVTTIGSFANCVNLVTITIPSSVTTIRGSAFNGCVRLESITLPSGITSIESSTFWGCKSLSSVTIPDSVTSIGAGAFDGCSGLDSIVVPAGVTSIGEGAFDSQFNGAGGLSVITVKAGNTNYRSIDGILYDASGTTLLRCPQRKLGQITIPAGVTRIAKGAFFRNGNSLYGGFFNGSFSVSLPSSVTDIEQDAFGFASIASIEMPGIVNIGPDAFSSCGSLKSITFPASLATVGGDAFLASALDCITFEGAAPLLGNSTISPFGLLFNAPVFVKPQYADSFNKTGFNDASSGLSFVTLGTNPDVTVQPQGILSTGDMVTFGVGASGSSSYQWKKDGANIAGATAASYSISSVSESDSGNYTVEVTTCAANFTSKVATLSVEGPLTFPSIGTQPSNEAAGLGGSITLSVGAIGGELSYQWYKGSAAIAGATGATYALSGIQAQDTGDYTVVVSNTVGSIESSIATVSVEMPPSIESQPSGSSIVIGDSLMLSVSASGESLSYQWKKNGSLITGATSASYTISIASESDAGEYQVVVSNAGGSMTSNPVDVSVSSAPALSVSTNLISITAGDDVVLTAIGLNGYYNLETIRWYTTGYFYPSLLSPGSSFSIYDASEYDEKTYWFEVETIEGDVIRSESFELTLDSASVPTMLAHPTSQSVTPGSSVTLSVSASGGSLSYQWYKGGSLITGATSATYTIGSASEADAGAYTVVVSNSAGSATSNAATLSVEASVTVPSIDMHPTSQSVTSGSSVTLGVSASGGSLSYQWYKGGSLITGATSATYTIGSASEADAGAYTVVVSNSAGSATSNAVTLTVEDFSGPGAEVPSIDTQPTLQSVTSGDNVTLSVSASGGLLSYQWQTYLPPSGWQDIEVATSSSYTATYNVNSDSGSFRVVVSNSAGSVTSEPVQVLVDDLSKSYALSDVIMTWSEAISYANSEGGYLLEINSYGEWLSIVDFLKSTFSEMTSGDLDNFFWSSYALEDSAAYVWLGGSDAAVEGEWRWASNNEQFWSDDKTGSAVNGAFNRWGTTMQQNEPDNSEGLQNALALALEAWPWQTEGEANQLGYEYEWNDIRADNNLYFIIEKDLSGPPVEPPLSVIESYGSTDLLEDSSGYYAGSADTPLFYDGSQYSSNYPYAVFTVLGVDLVNSAYRMVSSYNGQYYAMTFALSGNNSSGLSAVSDILVEEVNLQQDFDGDGHIGTPPPTSVDSDGDGLDDSVETNTGVYVSPSNMGTNPQLADSSGDGLIDGAVVSAGFNPNVDYSNLIAIISNSTVDMNLSSLQLERAHNGAFNMSFDLEMSTDLQTWTPHTNYSIELSVPDQSKTFMRLNVQ